MAQQKERRTLWEKAAHGDHDAFKAFQALEYVSDIEKQALAMMVYEKISNWLIEIEEMYVHCEEQLVDDETESAASQATQIYDD